MRPVTACICLLAGLALPVLANEPDVAPFHPIAPDATVIVDVKGQFPLGARRQMEREAEQIIASTGVVLDWRVLGESSAGTFKDLFVLTFTGSCAFDPAPAVRQEAGAFAFTHTADGSVQPFGQVDCDRIVNSVKIAATAEDRANPDLLVGRALGRVVAHELVHMLTRSTGHSQQGVQKPALSGRELVFGNLPLSATDIDRVKQRNLSRGTDTLAESESR